MAIPTNTRSATHNELDLSDLTAEDIQAALEVSANGATRWELSNCFSRNKSAGELDRAINLLLERGRIGFERETTGGRPCTRYWLK